MMIIKVAVVTSLQLNGIFPSCCVFQLCCRYNGSISCWALVIREANKSNKNENKRLYLIIFELFCIKA